MMKKKTKSLSITMLAAAAVQAPLATASVDIAKSDAAATEPLVMAFKQDPAEFSESPLLTEFSKQIIEKVNVAMMPERCLGDYDCYAVQCGTGTFCARGKGGVMVDDSDSTC